MSRLYIQKDSRTVVNNYLYFNDDAILILDNFIKTSLHDSVDLLDYLSWNDLVGGIRILRPDMMDSVYNFSNLMGWEVIIVNNNFGDPEYFIESCKEL